MPAQASRPRPAQASQPNIIFILADDIGREILTSYGGTSYNTPSLDRMANQGLRFSRAYSMPSCTPTRVHFFTGRSNARNYINFSVLDPNEVTISQLLQGAGYKTGAAGKWQLHGNYFFPEYMHQGSHPTDAGFDEWCLWQVKENGSRYWDPVVETHNGPPVVRTGEYGPEIFNDFAVDFIDRHKNEPFFLYYPLVLGHGPFNGTPPGYTPTSNTQLNFAHMVEYMDTLVGNVINKVVQCGIENDTLIIFTGDNGTSSQIYSDWLGYTVHGFKGFVTELGIRTPMLMLWPGKTTPSSITNGYLDMTDFFPTFCEMAGVTPPNDRIYDGKSFLGFLTGTAFKPRDHTFGWFWPKPDKASQPAPRKWLLYQGWKLYGHGAFYNVEKDPLESTDRSSSPNANIQAIKSHMEALIAGYPDRPPAWGG